MEHIVGIKVIDKIVGMVGFITWGRTLHPVSPDLLLHIVTQHLSKFGIHHMVSIEVCDTLQEVATAPYFYEAIFEFSQKIIPEGTAYKKWKQSINKSLEQGKEIYFLGMNTQQRKNVSSSAVIITHGFYYD